MQLRPLLSVKRAAAARRAGVLLLVLLAHLALMASSLHAAAMAPGMGASVEQSATIAGMLETTPMASAGCADAFADCMQAWLSPARPVTYALLSALLLGGVRPLLETNLLLGPAPQALGPPKAPDVQALLQVFRI